MKNRYIISIVFASLYFIASIFLFLIAKEKLNSVYAYFSILVGLIGAVYYLAFSLKQSLRQDLASPGQRTRTTH